MTLSLSLNQSRRIWRRQTHSWDIGEPDLGKAQAQPQELICLRNDWAPLCPRYFSDISVVKSKWKDHFVGQHHLLLLSIQIKHIFKASKTSWSRWQASNGDENITVLSTSGLHCWLQMCAAMFFSQFSSFNPGLCWAQQGFTAPQNSAAENSGDGCERSWAWFCGISTLVFVATPTLDFVASPCPTFTVAPFCLLPQIAGSTHRIIGSCTTCLHSAVH